VCPASSSQRVRDVLWALGRPQHGYPAIHVTGTNGKGSTATMASAVLAALGLRVGTYTSPHLIDARERVTINGRPWTPADLALAGQHVRTASLDLGLHLSWFEELTGAALWWFAEQRVDVAVVEVGRLGRNDATNVLGADVAVITNVQRDHTDVAGPTRAHIAAEKAAIITPGATLVLGEPDSLGRPQAPWRRRERRHHHPLEPAPVREPARRR
jgi:dihydrofolate synthase / folylpolyglutamate synthase